jgi:DNA-binding transcriptional LysR family regulator
MKPRSGRPSQAPLDWGDVQFFVAVAEEGSMAAAAKRLRVNHSTVLRRIAHLERELGGPLFDRLPGGYALTANGNALATHLAGLSDQVDATQRRLMGLDTRLEGPVRVAASDIVVEGLLMPLLAGFRRRHPGVRIHLVVNYRFPTLTKNEADIAVRGVGAPPKNLVAHHIGDLQTVPCASRGYLKRAGRRTPLGEHRWVVPDDTLPFRELDAWLRRHVAAGRIVARIDSLVGLADAVASGLGVGMLPLPLVAARPQLVQLAPPEPGLRKAIWLLMHPDVQHTARVRALYDYLRDCMSHSMRLPVES